jgi:adenylyltransferase/sulfurtransferase
VQVRPTGEHGVVLEELARKLEGLGPLQRNPYLLRLAIDPYVLTVFADGRAIVGGTDDPATARSVYARYVGN